MRGKLGIAFLIITSGLTFAAPISRPKDQCWDYFVSGPTVYNGVWFNSSNPGFHGGDYYLGAASSISAWYNSYTKNYTSHGSSLTISAGGLYGQAAPTLYVCQ
jgi:hypothetical protein